MPDNPKNFNAIRIEGNVSFTDLDGKKPKDTTSTISYHENADKEMKDKNTGHHHFGFKKGKYIGNTYPECYDRNYFFKISLSSSNQELIFNNNYVGAPCPDFCTTGS